MAALAEHDVVWVADRERLGREARVAPLSVAGADARRRSSATRTVVLTSATLKLGGDFTALAGHCRPAGGRTDDESATGSPSRSTSRPTPTTTGVPWRGLDVGSPFAYRQQGILYVARSLPPPGRDGLSEAALAEIAELVWAAGGRTLGLFSLAPRRRDRRRARAQAAAEAEDPVPGRRPAVRADPAVRRRRGRPACSAPCRCGRGSTCPAPPASW